MLKRDGCSGKSTPCVPPAPRRVPLAADQPRHPGGEVRAAAESADTTWRELGGGGVRRVDATGPLLKKRRLLPGRHEDENSMEEPPRGCGGGKEISLHGSLLFAGDARGSSQPHGTSATESHAEVASPGPHAGCAPGEAALPPSTSGGGAERHQRYPGDDDGARKRRRLRGKQPTGSGAVAIGAATFSDARACGDSRQWQWELRNSVHDGASAGPSRSSTDYFDRAAVADRDGQVLTAGLTQRGAGLAERHRGRGRPPEAYRATRSAAERP